MVLNTPKNKKYNQLTQLHQLHQRLALQHARPAHRNNPHEPDNHPNCTKRHAPSNNQQQQPSPTPGLRLERRSPVPKFRFLGHLEACGSFPAMIWFFRVRECGNTVNNPMFFDTVKISPSMDQGEIQHRARQKQINLRLFLDGTVDEESSEDDNKKRSEEGTWPRESPSDHLFSSIEYAILG
uniref:Uncharacterized protein n=1 Tax=Timema douglasi TaxID=61478 RepID=A0A7R8ZG80_TIMDO|nr:unnamed protein product [Timema douglasi]